MAIVTVDYALRVARGSEATILSRGGKVLSTLPYLDRSELRPQSDLIGRALALNAVIDLSFGLSPQIVKEWISRHNVAHFLTEYEASLLGIRSVSQRDKDKLGWSLDALWALMWAGNLFESLEFSAPIPDEMYGMCPHISDGEGPDKFSEKMKLRSFDEIYRTLDLYYRLHWYAFEYQLRGETETFDLSRFIERRRALEWLLSPTQNWDAVALNT